MSHDATKNLNEVMRKYDRESNTRAWEGKPKIAVQAYLAAFAIFEVYVTLFGTMLDEVRLTSFVGGLLIAGFLIFPSHKHEFRVNYVPWYDWVIMALGAVSFFYFCFNANTIVQQLPALKTYEVVLGVIGILALFELCRRSTGVPIMIVAGIFIAYALYYYGVKRGLGAGAFKSLVCSLFYKKTGILSTPINVCSKYIAVFIIFGAFLERTGISDFFIQLANSLAGSSAGGPAKVAVISSALCGMVSGSSVGNTVTTGSVTIPMMKKTGYKGEFAGAVEAAASTGGQIMPPVMGAAAFIMTEYIGCSYGTIALAACIPALLYFTGIFTNVHFEALKRGLLGLPKEQRPVAKQLIKDGWYMILPVIVIVALLCTGSSAMKAAIWGIISCLFIWIINIVREEKKFDAAKFAKMFVQGLADSAQSAISVAITCGCAGIIVGVVTMTGLGLKMANGLVAMAGGSLWLTMIFTMLCSIVLGMGVPTTANYIIQATISAPALVALGVPKLAAHMFVFYFGIVADITPPVALAAFAGSGIAGSNPMKTGFTATRLGIAAYIVPYMFVLNPILVLVNVNNLSTGVFVLMAIKAVVTAFIGMVGLASGSSGFFKAPCNLLERIVLIASGLLLIDPGTLTDIAGIGIILLIYFIQKAREKRTAVTG